MTKGNTGIKSCPQASMLPAGWPCLTAHRSPVWRHRAWQAWGVCGVVSECSDPPSGHIPCVLSPRCCPSPPWAEGRTSKAFTAHFPVAVSTTGSVKPVSGALGWYSFAEIHVIAVESPWWRQGSLHPFVLNPGWVGEGGTTSWATRPPSPLGSRG